MLTKPPKTKLFTGGVTVTTGESAQKKNGTLDFRNIKSETTEDNLITDNVGKKKLLS